MTKFFTVEQVIEIHDAFLQDHEEFVVRIAQGQKNKEQIAYFLKHGKEKQ